MSRPRPGAPADSGAFTVTAMTRTGGTVRMTIACRGSPDLAVLVTPRTGEPAYLSTAHLSIRYAGTVLTPAHEEALRLVAEGLKGVMFETLAEKVPAAPTGGESTGAVAAGPDGPAAGGPADGDRLLEVVTVDEWGNPDRWRTFIFRREFARNASSAIRLSGPRVVTVSHGESECQYATPPIDGQTMSVYNYPWVRPLERSGGDDDREPRSEPDLPGYVTTDLRDADIITGGTARLEAVLDHLGRLTGPGDVVIVKSTCVPHVIGDDMEGAASRWRGKGRVIYDDIFAKGGSDTVGDLLTEAVRRHKAPARRNAGTVNIAGLANSQAYAEIERILKAAGIGINCALIPEVDLRAAERWRNATLQVLVPNPYYRSLYEKALVPLKMRTIAPAAPYGVNATREWLGAISRACGRSGAFAKAWTAAEASISERLARVREEAARHRLGFVVAPGDYAALCDPMETAGIPMLDVIVEIGFGLRFIVYDAPDAPAAALDLMPAHAGAAKVVHFRDRASLGRLLRDDGCDAVYSDLYGDERITAAGKAPFSLQFFEPGLPGAIRTGERLLGACTAPFYRKYGRHAGAS